MSQCQVIGRAPVKTWSDYRKGCLDTYAGGHRNDGHLEAFQHGMETVFNLLEAEFPPAEQCKVLPELIEALLGVLNSAVHPDTARRAVMVPLDPVRTALKKAGITL